MTRPHLFKVLPVLGAAALGACYADIPKDDPRYAEMIEHKAWMEQLKEDDPDTVTLLAKQCYAEGSSLFSSEGVLELSRCMHRKYDEGVRAS